MPEIYKYNVFCKKKQLNLWFFVIEEDCTEKKHAIGHNLEEIVLCGSADDVKTVIRNLQVHYFAVL